MKEILNTSGRWKIGVVHLSKCEMARHKLCKKSSFGYCVADDKELKTCPYLKAIEEIAKLAIKTEESIKIGERKNE